MILGKVNKRELTFALDGGTDSHAFHGLLVDI